MKLVPLLRKWGRLSTMLQLVSVHKNQRTSKILPGSLRK